MVSTTVVTALELPPLMAMALMVVVAAATRVPPLAMVGELGDGVVPLTV